MGEDFRTTGQGDPAPVLIQTSLRLPAWLLQGIAEQSKRTSQSIEEVIVEILSGDFRARGRRQPGDEKTDSLLDKPPG